MRTAKSIRPAGIRPAGLRAPRAIVVQITQKRKDSLPPYRQVPKNNQPEDDHHKRPGKRTDGLEQLLHTYIYPETRKFFNDSGRIPSIPGSRPGASSSPTSRQKLPVSASGDPT